MLTQKFQNFAHSSLNFPITQINTNIENKYLVHEKKIKKPVGGVCSSPLAKMIHFYKRDILSKDPQNSQKDGSKSEKYKKPVGGVCSSQDWSQKNPVAKRIFFLSKGHFEQRPPNSKKNGLKSEKYKFTNICTWFFQRGQIIVKGFQQNSIKLESESDILPQNGHDSS